ncbi:hypothetical protein K2173_015477 [Erythroxylum novogranatense]|uniref:Uncharacterized protein n=1 Tax=Erythroxylum novogranatense TaxID=1862640 RepID=A0AAV8SSR9_9ROSI|nr:hypothetical protein K2173_015477 [Erythroxylum novogranatense]
MAGIAIVLDLLKKNPNFYSPQFSASSAVSVAAASIAAAASTPFASRFLLGYPRIPVAHCDAGATPTDDYISNIQRVSGDIFKYNSLRYTTKEYHIELKPVFSAFEWKQLAITSLRSFALHYLPLLEPRIISDEDDDNFLQDVQQDHQVDLVVPLQKSLKQIVRETTVVTTRRILERLAVHYVSQRIAWKLLKDVPKSTTRKAQRTLPTVVYIFKVSRTTFRGHCLGVAASWIVQVGIEIFRFFSRLSKSDGEKSPGNKSEVRILGKKITGVTIRCSASLVFASVGAGIGATLIRPSTGQWIGCAVGDLAGPIIVSIWLDKAFNVEV